MGVLVAGIDVAKVSVENEFRIGVLEGLLDLLLQRSGVRISATDIEAIRQATLVRLQAKYPDMGLRFYQGQPG